MSDEPPPRPFTAIFDAFPDLAQLARALDLPHATVVAWKRRNSVPESRWRAIAAAAKALKVKDVTYESLSKASAAKIVAEGPRQHRTRARVLGQ